MRGNPLSKRSGDPAARSEIGLAAHVGPHRRGTCQLRARGRTQRLAVAEIPAGNRHQPRGRGMAEQALRRWYTQAGRLTRSAIKRRVQPEQQQHMRDLLGL